MHKPHGKACTVPPHTPPRIDHCSVTMRREDILAKLVEDFDKTLGNSTWGMVLISMWVWRALEEPFDAKLRTPFGKAEFVADITNGATTLRRRSIEYIYL